MKIIACRVGEEPKQIEIENTLEAMQEFVGGYIEVVSLGIRNLVLVCDDEGKLKEKLPNYELIRSSGNVDVIVGDFFICKAEGEDMTNCNGWQDFHSLTVECPILRRIKMLEDRA